MNNAAQALELGEVQGIPVFPLKPDKSPLTDHGFKDASCNMLQIQSWWKSSPDALIGIPTGHQTGLLVIDIDPEGARWYADHFADLACGFIAKTRREDGRHLYYRLPDNVEVRNSTGKLAAGVDVRGEGGYVVAWWAMGHETTGSIDDLTEPPDWLLKALQEPAGAGDERAEGNGGEHIPRGQRNSRLASIAGAMRRQGMNVDEIAEALRTVNARCDPPLADNEVVRIAESVGRYEPDLEESGKPLWPEPVDLADLAEKAPEPPSAIIADWMPCGYATMIAGHGGVGKSAIGLHLSACIALGRPFFGLPTKQRRVMYLSCEDRRGVLHWRLSRICLYEQISMAELDEKLVLLDLVGSEAMLWERNQYKGTTITPAFAELRLRLNQMEAEVLVIDGVSDTYGGNENDRFEVKRYVNAMVSLIPPENGAVVLIAHVNKLTAQGGSAEGYSGSTGWHNAVRARWYLYPESQSTDDGVERTGRLNLELQKSNLGRTDQVMQFRWDTRQHLFVGEVDGGLSHFDRNQRDERERQGILEAVAEVIESGDYVPAAAQGPRTAHHVLAATNSLPESMKSKGNRRRFWRHIETLRRMGALREGSMRRENRHVTATLELKATSDKGRANASN